MSVDCLCAVITAWLNASKRSEGWCCNEQGCRVCPCGRLYISFLCQFYNFVATLIVFMPDFNMLDVK